MSAKFQLVEPVFRPFLLESFGEAHDEKEKKDRCHAVALFHADLERYSFVNFPDYKSNRAASIHACDCRP